MELRERQPPWLYCSQTMIALLWFTTHIHAKDLKYPLVDHFYKFYPNHIFDGVQSRNLRLPNLVYSDCSHVGEA